MRDVKRFPTTTGLSWLEMSSFKEHLFKGHEKIGKEYDYVIVGGGYGGYGCASRLAELQPEARIAVFEAIKIGNGDSGKNAGFIIDVPHNFGDQGNSTFEDNEMYYKLNTFIIGRMRKTIEDSGIKVDWDPCGKYLCCSETKSFKLIETESEELDQMKVHYEIYEGEELAQAHRHRYYKKALYTPGTLLVNPADVLRRAVYHLAGKRGCIRGMPRHAYRGRHPRPRDPAERQGNHREDRHRDRRAFH